MNKTYLITGASMVFISVMFIVIISNYVETQTTHIENVDCYDRYSNKIVESVCEKEVYDNESFNYFSPFIFILLLLLSILAFLGVIWIVMGFIFKEV